MEKNLYDAKKFEAIIRFEVDGLNREQECPQSERDVAFWRGYATALGWVLGVHRTCILRD